jgi:chemotaxis protein methyltransferase CheR
MINNYNLSDKDFNRLRDIIYNEAGIKLSDVKKALMQSRLMKRLRELQLANFTEYHDYLLEHYEKEKINFINAITTNKTDFFRENEHFEFMKKKILPDFDLKKEREIRIWSAGCSTGEEPYTIAITLHEYYSGKKAPEFLILATDIDTQVLNKAQDGLYAADHLADVESKYLNNYFTYERNQNGAFYRAKDKLKEAVYYRRLNLLVEQYPMKKQFDIIFCRNVIIYFDKETQKKLFEKFYGYLKDDGYLLIGHSENITNITDKFYLVGRTIYKKVV